MMNRRHCRRFISTPQQWISSWKRYATSYCRRTVPQAFRLLITGPGQTEAALNRRGDLDAPSPLSNAARDTAVAIAEVLLRAALDRHRQCTPCLDSMSPHGAARQVPELRPTGSSVGNHRRCRAAAAIRHAGEA